MSEPFLAEVRIVGFNFAPRGWAECNGQLLPISQNQALFSLLGITYGGDGRNTFALPDLRARTPVHVGGGIVLGEEGGSETHTLGLPELPAHGHSLFALSENADSTNPAGRYLSKTSGPLTVYEVPASPVAMASQAVSNAGGNLAHPNMQPYLAVNFIIALTGQFPSRN